MILNGSGKMMTVIFVQLVKKAEETAEVERKFRDVIEWVELNKCPDIGCPPQQCMVSSVLTETHKRKCFPAARESSSRAGLRRTVPDCT